MSQLANRNVRSGETHPTARLKDSEIALMREMWAAKVWEGYKVTTPRLAEWFFTDRTHALNIVKNKVRRAK